MRSTFICILFGLAVKSIAVPSGFETGGEALQPLLPKTDKRSVTIVEGLHSREIGGGFIAVLPKDASFPVKGDDDASKRRRRFLRQEEVVVPDSLQESGSKRAISCGDITLALCPDRESCCPVAGQCCSDGGCCPALHSCVVVNGKGGCCPIDKICTTGPDRCVNAGYVKCANYNFCCKPGYTCYRDSAGRDLCRAPGSNNDDNDPTTTTRRTTTTTRRTTTTTTTTPVAKPTTIEIPKNTTTTEQVTISDSFAFPTTSAAVANTTSSSARASSTPDIPVTANTNGAMAVTSGMGYNVLRNAVLLALGHLLAVA